MPPPQAPPPPGRWGRFDGRVVGVWLDDGKSIELTEPFTYTDVLGHEFQAHVGDVVDGASIPRFFWRIIGSPLQGPYRRASVIHDVYYHMGPPGSRDEVDLMFYAAMRFEGTGWLLASLMYWAVRSFGWAAWKRKPVKGNG